MRDSQWMANKLVLSFRIFSFVSAALALVFSIGIPFMTLPADAPPKLVYVFLFLLGGFLYFLMFNLFAEMLSLLVRIELNTRRD
jgi:hypothetical protein